MFREAHVAEPLVESSCVLFFFSAGPQVAEQRVDAVIADERVVAGVAPI